MRCWKEAFVEPAVACVGVQLVSVADGYHLWSERYDRDVTDVFDIQDELPERSSTSFDRN